MNDNFYIHLHSDVKRSDPLQAGNTIGNFITRLNRRIKLEGRWEVALSRIHYTKSWYNVPDDQILYLVGTEKIFQALAGGIVDPIFELEERFPKGTYKTITDILNTLNLIYAKHVVFQQEPIFKSPPIFDYDKYSNTVRIKLGQFKMQDYYLNEINYAYPQMSPFLAKFLGLIDNNHKQYPFKDDLGVKYMSRTRPIKTKGFKIIPPIKLNSSNSLLTTNSGPIENQSMLTSVFDVLESNIKKIVDIPNVNSSSEDNAVELNSHLIDDNETQVNNTDLTRSNGNDDQNSNIEYDNDMLNDENIELVAKDDLTDTRQDPNDDAYIFGFRAVTMHGFMKNMNIYCNLMEPVLVGDVSAPLLRSIALFDGDKYGDNIDYEPYEREYNPLITNEFQHIDIDIKDDYNKTLDFKFGKIYLSLHFRKIRE